MSPEPAGTEAEGPDPQRGSAGGDEPEGRREPAWTRLIAPLRSEDAAFRTVVWAAAIALTLTLVVVLVRLIS